MQADLQKLDTLIDNLRRELDLQLQIKELRKQQKLQKMLFGAVAFCFVVTWTLLVMVSAR